MEAVLRQQILLRRLERTGVKTSGRSFLHAGTILGAVRHRGFIPWDDDIDVMLFRSEYDRLCQCAADFQFPYFFQTEYTDPGARRGHAQLRNSATTGILKVEYPFHFSFNQGIFLDIFPIDHVPDDEGLFDRQIREAWRHKRNCDIFFDITGKGLGIPGTGLPKTLYKRLAYQFLIKMGKIGLVRNMLNYQKEYRKFENAVTRYNDRETKRVAKYFSLPVDKARRVWPTEDFASVVYLPFEFLSVPAPSGYMDILDRFYRNGWREFQIGTSSHGGVYFDTDIPYQEYWRAEEKEPLTEEKG